MNRTAIANQALLLIGESTINSLEDPQEEANEVNVLFELAKKKVIAEHPWKFARKRSVLQKHAESPLFGYSHRYVLPSDYISVIQVNDGCDEWTIEDRYLLANIDTVELVYTFNIDTDINTSPLFDDVLAHWLGYLLCRKLTEGTTVREEMYNGFMNGLRKARFIDSTQGNDYQFEDNELLEARTGYGGFPRDPMT